MRAFVSLAGGIAVTGLLLALWAVLAPPPRAAAATPEANVRVLARLAPPSRSRPEPEPERREEIEERPEIELEEVALAPATSEAPRPSPTPLEAAPPVLPAAPTPRLAPPAAATPAVPRNVAPVAPAPTGARATGTGVPATGSAKPAAPPRTSPRGPYGEGEVDAGPRANGGNRDPEYPRSLLRRRRPPSGTVELRFTIDERGAVTDLELISDGGTPAFGEAALARVRGWRFTPARKDGRAVPVRVRKTFRFAVSDR